MRLKARDDPLKVGEIDWEMPIQEEIIAQLDPREEGGVVGARLVAAANQLLVECHVREWVPPRLPRDRIR